MKKPNKKSKMFALGLSMVLLLVLLQIFYLVNSVMGDLKGKAAIGANQVSLFNSIQEGEKSMLYGEIGFGLAFQQALYDIAKGGGTTEEPDCGRYLLFNSWRRDKDNECYPLGDDVKEELIESTLNSLNNYLSKNPYTQFPGRYRNNHEITLEQRDDRLIARAYAFLPERDSIICKYGYDPSMIFEWSLWGLVNFRKVVSSSAERTGICGWYQYLPAFRKEIKFNMDDFADASSAAEEFADDVQQCIDGGNTSRKCVFDNLPSHPKISLDCSSDVGDVYNSFVKSYETNLKSETSDCVFFYSPPHLIERSGDDESELRIKVISEGENTSIKIGEYTFGYHISEYGFERQLDAKGPYVIEYYNDPDNPATIPSSEEIQYAITYDKDGKLTNQELNYGKGVVFTVDWDLPENIMFYKEKPGKVAFIDTNDYDDFVGVKRCSLQKENTFSFCYDTGSSVLAYGEEDFQNPLIQPLKIQFALSFPSESPE